MALKSVVTDRFFDEIISALRDFERARKPLGFVLLTSSRLKRNAWKLTIAAPWLDSGSLLKAMSEIREFVSPGISSGEKLDGVLVRSSRDMLVRAFSTSLDVPELGTAYGVFGPELEEFNIDEAVCLLSRPSLLYNQALVA